MLALYLLTLTLVDTQPNVNLKLESIGRLKHEAIRETSGIVKSRRYPGILWVLNDSGNPNTIFAVKLDGSLVAEFRLNVLNIDWEDIATDDEGHLYIGDIGNNGGLLGRRAVHQIEEPDPSRQPTFKEPLKVLKSWYYQFPNQERFDAEGMFVQGQSIRLVGKTNNGINAAVYALAIVDDSPRLKPQVIKQVSNLEGFVDPVTGADISSDGKRLVVCSYGRLAIYQLAEGGTWKLKTIRPFQVNDQIEAICWDGADLILAGEKRGIYRVSEKDWRGDGN